jgi:hypothetical protein
LNSFYDCEKIFVDLRRGLGREVLGKNLGEIPQNRRKKNFTTLGSREIAKWNPFSEGKNGFQISPRMQEVIVYAGLLDCYGRSNEAIMKFLQVDVSSAQVYRVTDTYGEELGKTGHSEKTLSPPPVCQKQTFCM